MTYISRFRTVIGLSLAVLVAACGGGGGGGDDDSSPTKPQAQVTASADSVQIGTAVNFDGSGSSSPSGGSLTYLWSVIDKPEGSTAALSSSSNSSTTLTPDKAGNWTVSLTVNNGTTASDPVHKQITVTEPPVPVAAIYAVSGALPNIGVQLDGSSSAPPTGGQASALVYEWTLVEVPTDSAAVIDDPTIVNPRFTPDKEGVYTVQLIVHYDEQTSEPVTHTVEVLAEAAAPTSLPKLTTATPTRGQAVQLDGSGSSNPDGAPLNYFWRWGLATGRPYTTSGRPVGSKAEIENPTSATPSFVPDMAGTYTLQLMVWSGKRVGIAAVTVRVVKPADAVNTKPVAAITPYYYNYTFEAEPSIDTSRPVAFGSSSYDIDGDSLTPEWKLVSYPSGFDPATSFKPGNPATYEAAGFVPTHVGSYVAELRVYDGKEWSEKVSQVYKVLTGANIAPTATIKTAIGARTSTVGGAMLRASTQVGHTVTLDGTQSVGGNGDQIFYSWELVYKPPGSQATLDELRATHPKFTPDVEGPYLVRLQVQDVYGAVSRGTPELLIVARINNTAPILRPFWGSRASTNHTDEQPTLLGTADQKRYLQTIYISPSALDADGDEVDVLLSLTGAPDGGWPTVRQWTTSTINGGGFSSNSGNNFFQPTVSGIYTFQLIGSDGADQSALHTLKIPMATVADYPSLLLRGNGGASPNFPLWTFETSTFEHMLFPLKQDMMQFSFGASSTYRSYTPGSPETEGLVNGYKLNAPAGKSYTIIDVKAESEDPSVAASFIGLTEGQVIAAGTSVEFKLNVTRWSTPRTDDNPATPYPKARWFFRVKEKPEWTFSVENTLYGTWTPATAPSPDP